MYQSKCMKACTLHLFFLHCKLFKFKKNKQTNQNEHMQNTILFPYKQILPRKWAEWCRFALSESVSLHIYFSADTPGEITLTAWFKHQVNHTKMILGYISYLHYTFKGLYLLSMLCVFCSLTWCKAGLYCQYNVTDKNK